MQKYAFLKPDHPISSIMHLFPEGLPIEPDLEYQMPDYHNKGWFNIIGRFKYLYDGFFHWGMINLSNPDKIDKPFYMIDTSRLTFEQIQEISKAYRKLWSKSVSLCSDNNLIGNIIIPLESVERVVEVEPTLEPLTNES
jgi:hypothetical protein